MHINYGCLLMISAFIVFSPFINCFLKVQKVVFRGRIVFYME